MGLIHYNGNPSGSDAALYTSSGVLTPLKEIVACNAGAGDATITLSVHRAISAVVEPVATALLVRVGHARSLVADVYEPLGEILLDQSDSLHGSATSVAPAALTGLAVTGSATGGSFATGNYFWKITAVSAAGESAGSAEVTASITSVTSIGSAALTWSALPAGTTAVKVYRGTVTNTENVLVATLGAVTAYTDTGIAGTSGSPPAAGAAVTVVAFE